jgi:hypothetical protein
MSARQQRGGSGRKKALRREGEWAAGATGKRVGRALMGDVGDRRAGGRLARKREDWQPWRVDWRVSHAGMYRI